MTVEYSTTVYIFLGTSQNEAPLSMTLDPAQTDTHTYQTLCIFPFLLERVILQKISLKFVCPSQVERFCTKPRRIEQTRSS